MIATAHPARKELLADFARDQIVKLQDRSRRKQVPFALSLSDIEKAMEDQDWRCSVSGVPFFQVRRAELAFQPSLDRIDPKQGYVAGNVRIVAYIVNVAMNRWGEDPLWRLVEMMASRFPVSRLGVNIRDTNPKVRHKNHQ